MSEKAKVDVLGNMERASTCIFCKCSETYREMDLWLSRHIVEELLESIDKYLDDSILDRRMDLIDARNRIGSLK